MSIIVNGVELTEVIYAGVNLDIVKVKKGAAEAVTVFEKITQLTTPQNVTANGTTVSWDAVENATSYAVLADGVSIGEYTPFNVTITGNLEYTYIKVYDIEGGTLLYTFDNSDKSHTFTGVTSLFIDAGSVARVITSVTTTAGITSNRTTGHFYNVTITAEADGTVTIVQEND